MNDVTNTVGKKNSISTTALGNLLNWHLIAALSFICVVLLYQFFVGGLSCLLGYNTHIHFGKVDSLPGLNRFWSSTRVLILYGLPPVLLLVFAAFLLAALLFAPKKGGINWRWTGFWLMVFSTLLGTTLFSISLISAISFRGSLFQGFAVVNNWFGLSLLWSIGFMIVAGVINISFGFFCSEILMQLAPPDFIMKEESNSSAKIVLNSFIIPLVLLLPVAVLLSYPGHLSFFLVMFSFACLWFPGLLNTSETSLKKRRARGKSLESHSNYLLSGLALLLIVIIRIFLN